MTQATRTVKLVGRIVIQVFSLGGTTARYTLTGRSRGVSIPLASSIPRLKSIVARPQLLDGEHKPVDSYADFEKEKEKET